MARTPALGSLEQGVIRFFGLAVCAAVVLPTAPRLGAVAGTLAVLLGAAAARRLPGSSDRVLRPHSSPVGSAAPALASS